MRPRTFILLILVLIVGTFAALLIIANNRNTSVLSVLRPGSQVATAEPTKTAEEGISEPIATATPAILWLGFALMTAVLAALWLPLRPGWIPARWRRRATQLAEGWGILGQNGRLVQQLTGLQIMMTALFAARFWLAFHMLSQPVSYADCLLFAAATVLSRLVSLAPGGLGVREGIVGGMAAILGFDVGASVVAVGLERLVSTLVVIIVGVIYSYLLSRAAVASQPSEGAES